MAGFPGTKDEISGEIIDVNIVGGGSGNGAILDGVDSLIKATVLDYSNSNPVAVRLTDTAGDYVAAGAGTQYTEDAAAAANPVGGALILVREDARAGGLVTTDGDNVAARGNNKGEQYVIDTDANAKLTTITGHVDGIETLLTAIDGHVDQIEGYTDGIEALLGTNNTDTAAIAASASVLDDWDESDRAKVNIIAGQVGVDGNSGNKSAATQRVVLATDQPTMTNPQPITVNVPTTIYNGKKAVTTAGTRVTLASTTAVKSVTVKALSTNTGIIYVGDASVASTTGFQLLPGESVSMDIADLATVNLDSSVNGESVTYLAVN
jgi:hypothetical protein